MKIYFLVARMGGEFLYARGVDARRVAPRTAAAGPAVEAIGVLVLKY